METVQEQSMRFIHEKASEYDVSLTQIIDIVWPWVYEIISLIDNKFNNGRN